MKLQQKLRGAVFKSKKRLYKASPTIMTVIAGVGVVTTVVLAVKATPKALELIRDKKAEEKVDQLTPVETVQTVWKCYIPTVGAGAITMACIFGSNALNRKQQANLIAAYTFLDKSYRKYRHKVVEMLGKDGEKEIQQSIAKDNYDPQVKAGHEELLLYEPISERYFSASMEALIDAEYHFNRNFVLRGYTTLNELYDFLGLDNTEFGSTIGWSIGAGLELYGYEWVDFELLPTSIDDGSNGELECYILHMPFEPTPDYLDY